MTRSNQVYECKQCGQCCHGQGGIFITNADALAIAAFLNMEVEEFSTKYTGHRIGRLEITVGEDGVCHFLKDNTCFIHPVKPHNCRLWPFMHGAVTEEWGFKSMKGNCPGFDPEATWEEFLEYYEASKNGS